MLGALQLWRLRRKLRGSLAADPFQVGWNAWLDAATSTQHLLETCSRPGWLVHVAYWNDRSQDKLVEAALEMAQLAIEHGPPNVFPRETVLDLRQIPFADIAQLITKLERKVPAIVRIERALPGVSSIQLKVLDDAREAAGTPDGEKDLAKAGKAGAAAAGFSLALQTLFHRQYGMREPLALSAAGAGAMFHVAMPDHALELMALVRDRFGWG